MEVLIVIFVISGALLLCKRIITGYWFMEPYIPPSIPIPSMGSGLPSSSLMRAQHLTQVQQIAQQRALQNRQAIFGNYVSAASVLTPCSAASMGVFSTVSAVGSFYNPSLVTQDEPVSDNVHDKLEDFLEVFKEEGIEEGKVREISLNAFIDWTLIKACEEDGAEVPKELRERFEKVFKDLK